jgi:hypothetical protein
MAIPANRTFTELRTQVNEQIEGITDPVNPRQAASLLRALTKQQTLDQISSTDTQRARYLHLTGRTWEQDFMSVREVRFMTIGGLTGDRLIEHLWRELPDSRFKRFQELFSDPDNFLIPRVTDGATGVSFLTAHQLNNCSVHPCLVSGDRLPSKLLQDLGIVTWPNRSPDALRVLQTKSSEPVVEAIKAIFDSTRSVGGRNQRVRLLGQPSTGEGTLYPNAIPLPARLLGSVLILRDDGGADTERSKDRNAPWEPPHKVVQFYSTVYAAYRKTSHETRGYDAEIAKVRDLSIDWRTLNTKINEDWRKDTPPEEKAELRAELTLLTNRTRAALGKVTNAQKKKADEFFKKIDTALQNGDKNIGKMLAQMVAGATRLERRVMTIPFKSRYNEEDRLLLKDTINSHIKRFKDLREALPKAAETLVNEIAKPGGLFSTTCVTDPERHAAARSLIRRMGLPIAGIQHMDVRPFLAFARLIALDHTALIAAVERQDPQEARQALARIEVVCKLQRANHAIEWLRKEKAAGKPEPSSRLASEAYTLHNSLTNRTVFPRASIGEYGAEYRAVTGKIQEIVDKLENDRRGELDQAGQEELTQNLERFFYEADLEASALTLLHGQH